MNGVLADWRANRGEPRIQILLMLFRLSQRLRTALGRWAWPISAIYRTYSAVFVGAELPVQTSVGVPLTIHHGNGLVVNGGSRIGCAVTLRQNTTIGNRAYGGSCPTIGDGVDVGAHVLILGEIGIADGAIIGAGSIVVHDVAEGVTVIPQASTARR